MMLRRPSTALSAEANRRADEAEDKRGTIYIRQFETTTEAVGLTAHVVC